MHLAYGATYLTTGRNHTHAKLEDFDFYGYIYMLLWRYRHGNMKSPRPVQFRFCQASLALCQLSQLKCLWPKCPWPVSVILSTTLLAAACYPLCLPGDELWNRGRLFYSAVFLCQFFYLLTFRWFTLFLTPTSVCLEGRVGWPGDGLSGRHQTSGVVIVFNVGYFWLVCLMEWAFFTKDVMARAGHVIITIDFIIYL